MYKNSNHGGRSHTGYTVYSSKNRRGSKNRSKGQAIDPARFIKAASASEKLDYISSNSFGDFAMHPLLKSNVTNKGYTAPSEIQDKTISLGLAGRNVVGVADTGTGKTAAFALPVLNNLMRNPGSKAIIIAPTRELALQIEEQCIILSKNSGIKIATLIGGMPIGRQINSLRSGARLIIGTPGRLKDHLNQKTLSLSSCSMVVLDEVDRMLDMGFLTDVRRILSELPQDHQSYFFSATISGDIKYLIDTFCHDPEYINVKYGETSANVHQDVVRFSGNSQKIELLHEALLHENNTKTIVFGKTKYGVERLAKELVARGFKAQSIHGGKTQGQRKRALDAFRENTSNILVATDVAARGIDIKDISHVINYDTPQTYDDYVHRIGRAGRAGRAGHALTFVER